MRSTLPAFFHFLLMTVPQTGISTLQVKGLCSIKHSRPELPDGRGLQTSGWFWQATPCLTLAEALPGSVASKHPPTASIILCWRRGFSSHSPKELSNRKKKTRAVLLEWAGRGLWSYSSAWAGRPGLPPSSQGLLGRTPSPKGHWVDSFLGQVDPERLNS